MMTMMRQKIKINGSGGHDIIFIQAFEEMQAVLSTQLE